MNIHRFSDDVTVDTHAGLVAAFGALKASASTAKFKAGLIKAKFSAEDHDNLDSKLSSMAMRLDTCLCRLIRKPENRFGALNV